MSAVPEDTVDEIRDVLAHFYDYAYLVRHPLLRRWEGVLGDDVTAAVQRLRRMILEAIEGLRPRFDIPSSDPAWRPHAVLYHRYVLGKELFEVERELSIGVRQIQREQRRAIEAVSIALGEILQGFAANRDGPHADAVLWEEISRAATEQQVFDAGVQLERALASVGALAQRHQVGLRQYRGSAPMLVLGSPALFKQLLVGVLSFVIRSMPVGGLTVHMERQRKSIVCSLIATASPAPAKPPQPPELPETLLLLAEAQGAEIRSADGDCHLRISLPAVEERLTVIAVEDNQDLIALFSRYLAQHGYHVMGVTDSTTAFERIAEVMPDAVLLDVMMPETDGWELLQRMKSDPRLHQIPVAVCSVLDESELASSLGASAYLRKPIRPAQLLESLSGLLGR